jgi:hypothetical protein
LELKHQREKVLKRVQATGGWERLKNDCLIFAKTNQEHGVFWIGRTTNHVALPSAIEGLKPQEIRFDPGSISANDKFYYPVIHLKIFGMHSTGGHSTPYYGLDVICGKESTSHQPAPYASGNSHYHYRKIADSIYEVY